MISLRIDASDFDQLADDIDRSPDESLRDARRAFGLASEDFIGFHRQRRLRGRPGLFQRHGQAGLAGAVQYQVVGASLNELRAVHFVASRYARIHEYGGEIRPKRGKALRFVIGGRPVFAKKVTIPARLGYRSEWDNHERRRGAILRKFWLEKQVRRLADGPS